MKQPATITILGICGSLRTPSYTRQALEIALAAAQQEHVTTILLATEALALPLCDGRSQETYVHPVRHLCERVQNAQGLLIGSPEYCGTFSAVIKNVIEWLSPSGMYGKVVGILTVAEGSSAAGAATTLQQVCIAQGAWVVPTTACIPLARETFQRPDSALGRHAHNQITVLGAALPRAVRRLQREAA